MDNCFRIRSLGHTFNRTDFRATVISGMGYKVLSGILTGIDSNMSNVPSRDVLKNNQGADWELLIRRKIASV